MADISRLIELQSFTNYDEKEEKKPQKKKPANSKMPAHLSNHVNQYKPIKDLFTKIRQNVKKINDLKNRDLTSTNDQARKEIKMKLEALMSQTTRWGGAIKITLDDIKEDNNEYMNSNPKSSATSQMRMNLYQQHFRRFHKIMNEYNAASHEFKKNLQDRTRRQLKTIDPDISDVQVERIIESGQANDIIKHALISEDLEDCIQSIEERHLDILKLEQQVLEVNQLFKDLAQLVDIQQESLDIIETRIVVAKDYTEKAEEELETAENYQNKARKRQCILIGLLVTVLLIVVLVMTSS